MFNFTVISNYCGQKLQIYTLRLNRTRDHPYKRIKHFNSCSIRSIYFSERVVNVWNCLSPEMIDFSSLASFRRSLEATDLGALILIRSLSQFVFVFYIPCKFVCVFLFLLGIRFYGCLKCILCLVVLPCWCFGAFMYVMCQFTANKYDTIRYDTIRNSINFAII